MTLLKFYELVIALMSLLAFLLMGMDKLLAKWGMRRISEKTLLGTAIAGGAAGSWLAMNLFRHKTQHRAFSVGLPLLALLQGALLLGLMVLSSQGGVE